jgi:hypothetical protein
VYHNLPHGGRQASNGEMMGDARGGMSISDDSESCGKQTVWNKIRAFLEFFKRDKLKNNRHNSGSIKLDDLKIHGLKNTKSVKIRGFSENVLIARFKFPNLMLTSNYEVNNWGKMSSYKINGNGRMEMALKNVKIKISLPIIEELHNGQKSLKAISPQIGLKMKR